MTDMAEKRAADDAARYREALSMIERMQPMAERLYDWRIDPNGRLADTLGILRQACMDIIEKLADDASEEGDRAIDQGYRDWASSGGNLYSDRRPLAAKAGGAHSVYR